MSKRSFEKEPLYRKVNTRTHGVRHGDGGQARWQRNTKGANENPDRSMHSSHRHGRDYTPLFRFLVSRAGRPWDAVHSEAVSRLDDTDPIFRLVALDPSDAEDIVRCGESSYFSGLFVDGAGILRLTNPDLSAKTMRPFCHCCTHTFNGEVFGIKTTREDFDIEGDTV